MTFPARALRVRFEPRIIGDDDVKAPDHAARAGAKHDRRAAADDVLMNEAADLNEVVELPADFVELAEQLEVDAVRLSGRYPANMFAPTAAEIEAAEAKRVELAKERIAAQQRR